MLFRSSRVFTSTLVSFSLIFGFFTSYPLFDKDHKFRQIFAGGDGETILNTLRGWPPNDFQLVTGARLFYRNNYPLYGKQLLNEALAINPRNYDATKALFDDPNLSENEKEILKAKLHKLDPLNPSWKP